ncbi:hypothetical protein BN1864_LIB5394:05210 [Pseudomonas sp. 1 R 17]|nr:hypothetical protein BN1864_LIB5394:05210 [Pseudomonas sp. 1 R 17]
MLKLRFRIVELFDNLVEKVPFIDIAELFSEQQSALCLFPTDQTKHLACRRRPESDLETDQRS